MHYDNEIKVKAALSRQQTKITPNDIWDDYLELKTAFKKALSDDGQNLGQETLSEIVCAMKVFGTQNRNVSADAAAFLRKQEIRNLVKEKFKSSAQVVDQFLLLQTMRNTANALAPAGHG
ncbi:MAG: hypothetical protein H6860_02150 [Rhodospirillales bacterium]|nr:hypothetical protein [Alphaproteobacteria bacterium]MCB9981182.1 hypothetical protein [Rhodospirillales bacterium]